MGTWVGNSEDLAEAITELKYKDLMVVASDLHDIVDAQDRSLDSDAAWAELLHYWAEQKVEAKQRRKEAEYKLKADAETKAKAVERPTPTVVKK